MLELVAYYLKWTLPYALCALPLLAAARGVGIPRLQKRGRRTTVLHETGLLLFTLYLAFLISQTILPRISMEGGWHIIASGQHSSINLIPLNVLWRSWVAFRDYHDITWFLAYGLGNALVFVPLGFFPPLIWRDYDLKKAALWSCLASAAIELIQLPLPRETDIDDVLLNTLGGVLGYLLFLALKKWAPRFIKKFRIG